MNNLKLEKIIEGHYFVSKPNWTCETYDQIPLGIYVEILNMHDATGEERYSQYPFLVSFEIMASNPSNSFDESDKDEPGRLSLLFDAHQYMGGVPIDHKLLEMDSSNKNITGELKAENAQLITDKPQFGTLAAQKGPGTPITYPAFKDLEASEQWAQSMIGQYGDVLMGLVGFILDQPINLAGWAGWSIIEEQAS